MKCRSMRTRDSANRKCKLTEQTASLMGDQLASGHKLGDLFSQDDPERRWAVVRCFVRSRSPNVRIYGSRSR